MAEIQEHFRVTEAAVETSSRAQQADLAPNHFFIKTGCFRHDKLSSLPPGCSVKKCQQMKRCKVFVPAPIYMLRDWKGGR